MKKTTKWMIGITAFWTVAIVVGVASVGLVKTDFDLDEQLYETLPAEAYGNATTEYSSDRWAECDSLIVGRAGETYDFTVTLYLCKPDERHAAGTLLVPAGGNGQDFMTVECKGKTLYVDIDKAAADSLMAEDCKVVFYADEPLNYVTNKAGTAEILYYDHWATIGEGGEAVYKDK